MGLAAANASGFCNGALTSGVKHFNPWF